MDPYATTLLILGIAFGLYMAWNIGANDVANAMGTSVGSGALTLKRAIILAAIFEFSGAYFVGANVSETVRKKIFKPTEIRAIHVQKEFRLDARPDEVELEALTEQAESNGAMRVRLDRASQAASIDFACGMIAALLAAGVWLQVASYFGLPVSTTHTIVGAVLGFGALVVGVSEIEWQRVIRIAVSWVVSPLMAGSISYFLFRMLLRGVFYRSDPIAAAKRVTPYLAFVVVVVLVGVTGFKALKEFWNEYDLKPTDGFPVLATSATAIVVGVIVALVAGRLVRRVSPEPTVDSNRFQNVFITRSLDKALKHLRRVEQTSTGEVQQSASDLLRQTRELAQQTEQLADPALTQSTFGKVERIFVYLQILSACFVAFAHGANDVANAIGPLSAAVQAIREGIVELKAPIPPWALALGGVGIVTGLATWGWRVMQTIGRRITELTPSRGFSAEFGAATTILLASLLGLPISTTHTLVGAVLGVGLARGIGAINLNTVRDIVAAWVITIPAGAGLAILFYHVLRMIFV